MLQQYFAASVQQPQSSLHVQLCCTSSTPHSLSPWPRHRVRPLEMSVGCKLFSLACQQRLGNLIEISLGASRVSKRLKHAPPLFVCFSCFRFGRCCQARNAWQSWPISYLRLLSKMRIKVDGKTLCCFSSRKTVEDCVFVR